MRSFTWYQEHSRCDQHHQNAHEAKRESPSESLIAFAYAEVDPIRQKDAEEIGNEDNGEAGASVVCLGQFRHPGWDQCHDEPNAESCNDTCANEHFRIDRAALKSRANE